MENSRVPYYNENIDHFEAKLLEDIYKRRPGMKNTKYINKIEGLVTIITYIIENISDDISLEKLSEVSGMSKFGVCRIFNSIYNTSPIKYIWKIRIYLAKEFILIAPNWSLTDISYASGFTSLAHFSRCFRKAYNKTPLKYKHSALSNTNTKQLNNNFDIIYGGKNKSLSKNNIVMQYFTASEKFEL